MSYRVFTRTWWKRNLNYPGGKEPHMGRKTTLDIVSTETEALRLCKQYNDTHDPGFLSRKAEYQRE